MFHCKRQPRQSLSDILGVGFPHTRNTISLTCGASLDKYGENEQEGGRMGFLLACLGLAALVAAGIYFFPAPRISFQRLYADAPQEISASLQAFRKNHPCRRRRIGGCVWEYLLSGDQGPAVVLLHGMAGSCDVWWQQIEALREHCRVVSVTYPPVNSLPALCRGVIEILDGEGIGKFHAVGSSLGGYLTQYLIALHPDRIAKAVFANTFPPNDLIAQRARGLKRLLPVMPEWLVMSKLRESARTSIYVSSGNSEITRAYLTEQSCGGMRKRHWVSRLLCVLEYFTPPDPAALGIPVLIIEADNDPLVDAALRTRLKETYPSAAVKTLEGAGHFPYLGRPDEYTRILLDFLDV